MVIVMSKNLPEPENAKLAEYYGSGRRLVLFFFMFRKIMGARWRFAGEIFFRQRTRQPNGALGASIYMGQKG